MKRPDFVIALMTVFVLGAAACVGGIVVRSGVPLDVSMLIANFVFVLSCYLTTLVFDEVLYQGKLDDLVGAYAKKSIDVPDLLDKTASSPVALGEKIWDYKPVARCVLLKAYATETQVIQDKLNSQLLAAVLTLFLVSAAAVIAGHSVAPTSSDLIGRSTGITISLIAIVVSFAFALARVYWALFELAQRNRTFIRDVEPTRSNTA
jgi:hypothetical protein